MRGGQVRRVVAKYLFASVTRLPSVAWMLLCSPVDTRNFLGGLMNRKGTAIAASLVAGLALSAGPAFAQDRGRDDNNTEGFYLGVAIGDFSSQLDSPDLVDDIDLDFDNQDAERFFAGWRFNRFAAVQVDYTDFGRSNSTVGPNAIGIEAESDGVTPAFVGTLPIGPIELYAKAGMMFYNVTIDDANGDSIDDDGNDPVYGVGIGYTFAKRLNLRAEYERVDIEELEDANAVWISASWRF
jgi:hypothetical protein